jgi:hypothetical protein
MRQSECHASLLKMQATYQNSSIYSLYPHKGYVTTLSELSKTKEPHYKLDWHLLALKTSYTKGASYTRKVNTQEGWKVIPPCRWMSQSPMEPTNHKNTKETVMTQWFFLQGSLVAGKLVSIVAIHSLGGSRANRHYTPHPQPGAAQPTQDEDHTSHAQSTRVVFRDLPWGRHKNPSQCWRSEQATITNSRSMIPQSPSCLGVGKHQE